jgi:hypothetical protein
MSRGGKIPYRANLSCPKCGRTGIAVYEENESPPHHPGLHGYDDRKLLDIEGEFKAGSTGYDPSIYCACGEKVR